MEKRFVLFVVLSTAIMLGYIALNQALFGPAPGRPQSNELAQDGTAQDDSKAKSPDTPANLDDGGAKDGPGRANETPADEAPPRDDKPTPTAGVEGEQPTESKPTPRTEPALSADSSTANRQWITLGRFDGTGHPLLVILNSRGAAVERIELVQRMPNGRFRFRYLEDNAGYLGYLGLIDEAPGVCRVHVVPPGTPAATAAPTTGDLPPGLQVGDQLIRVGSVPIQERKDVALALEDTHPEQRIELEVDRPGVGRVRLSTVLAERPLPLIASESKASNGPGPNPPSFRVAMGLPAALASSIPQVAADPGLATRDWELVASTNEGASDAVAEFRLSVPAGDNDAPPLEFFKRYRLARSSSESAGDIAYDLKLEFEVRNHSDVPQTLALRWEGPNGLPTEGWWYSNKIHPSFFGAAGARDVIWTTEQGKHFIKGAPEIYKQAHSDDPLRPLFVPTSASDVQNLRYVGVDTQYFCVTMMGSEGQGRAALPVSQMTLRAVGDVGALDRAHMKLTNSSFDLFLPPHELPAGATWLQRMVIFAGPKDPQVLERYDLGDALYYGWFPWVAKPLSAVLHLFYMIVRNYGLAIVLLTVVVRAAMFPLSRKAARSAAVMQEMAPELKRVAEKYKNDMEKRMQAQREIYAKYKVNPAGGCLLMFVQLPIFVGLYRCLSVDINLRQAPLIPGISWCSNLAGPDQLWRWPLPEFLAGETAWLGPYLNILPIVTIALFLVQQKLFTPPATDEQTRMQQQMMKFMMIFICVMFFKVPAGLCIYFIVSSLWGIGERLLLPKPTPATAVAHQGPGSRDAISGGDGASSRPRRKQRRH